MAGMHIDARALTQASAAGFEENQLGAALQLRLVMAQYL